MTYGVPHTDFVLTLNLRLARGAAAAAGAAAEAGVLACVVEAEEGDEEPDCITRLSCS